MSRHIDFKLNEQQQAEIEQAMNHSELPEVRQRATAIRLLHLGYEPEQVGEMLAVAYRAFMDNKKVIERAYAKIQEAENLTESLEDSEAIWLIEWGKKQVKTVLQGVADEEAADAKISMLMKVMRQMNVVVGTRNSTMPDQKQVAVYHFLEAYNQAFNSGQLPSVNASMAVRTGGLPDTQTLPQIRSEIAHFAAGLQHISPLEIMQALIRLAESPLKKGTEHMTAPVQNSDCD